jgi:hypothetical protein
VFLLIALYLALKLRKRKQLLNKSIEEERMLTDNYQSSGSLSDPNSAFSVAVKRAAEIPDSPVDNTR